jgi:hypothetical protein
MFAARICARISARLLGRTQHSLPVMGGRPPLALCRCVRVIPLLALQQRPRARHPPRRRSPAGRSGPDVYYCVPLLIIVALANTLGALCTQFLRHPKPDGLHRCTRLAEGLSPKPTHPKLLALRRSQRQPPRHPSVPRPHILFRAQRRGRAARRCLHTSLFRRRRNGRQAS